MTEPDAQLFDRFRQELKNSQEKILLLDYDGTLASFLVQKDQAPLLVCKSRLAYSKN